MNRPALTETPISPFSPRTLCQVSCFQFVSFINNTFRGFPVESRISLNTAKSKVMPSVTTDDIRGTDSVSQLMLQHITDGSAFTCYHRREMTFQLFSVLPRKKWKLCQGADEQLGYSLWLHLCHALQQVSADHICFTLPSRVNTNAKTNHVNLSRQGTPSPRTASRLSSLRPTQTKSLDPGSWAPMTLRGSTNSTNAVSQSPINQINPVIHPVKESSSFVPRRDIWTRHVWWVLWQKRHQEMTKNRFKYYLTLYCLIIL